MKLLPTNLLLLFALLLTVSVAATCWAGTGISGTAEISYLKYDAEGNGNKLLNGDTLAQKYSFAYTATNLRYRSQPRYYTLMVGYDWMSYDTTITTPQRKINLKESAGKFKYSGEIGYNADELPLRFRAYMNDNWYPLFKSDFSSEIFLIDNGLIYSIDGRGSYLTSGFTAEFTPNASNIASLRGLPRLLLDYRQSSFKNLDGFNRIDSSTRELAVSSLNQENNWLHYRRLTFENHLDPKDNFDRQQLQLGLIDHHGQRKWSALTNWIEVSADGQLTNTNSPSPDKQLEEYDVNLMAIATRKLWSARSFMNYNRQLDPFTIIESARLPVYVKGLYGPDTDWYFSLATNRKRQTLSNQNGYTTSATNTLTAGATSFKRSSFTLSPSLSLQTTKSNDGVDSYNFDASLESNSTRRFSDKLGLAGRVTFRSTDDGYNRVNSNTWSTVVDLTATYAPNSRFNYKVEEKLESGSGNGYLEPNRLLYGTTANDKIGSYTRNYLYASARWVPTATFSTGLDGSYDIITATDMRPSDITTISFQASYANQVLSSRLSSRYLISQNGYDAARYRWVNDAELQYRPDRYTDALLRLSHYREKDVNTDRTRIEILQRYSYNLFTRNGILRNLATLSEEYAYNRDDNNNGNPRYQYLMFSGRYNPTERLSLYGSVKYQNDSPGSNIMYYTAGMNADFKLLATSLDYIYAKRDSDNRIEKRLNAAVSRSF